MLRLALHNLFQNRVRFIISVGGAALAFLLILTLDAIFTGLEGQITAYMDNSGADIFVSQSGVRNMHMTASTLPGSVFDEVSNTPGIEAATPILYTTNVVMLGKDQLITYVIGVPPAAAMGIPWRIVQGASIPAAGQAIVDYGLAVKAGLNIGDKVKTLGQEFVIAGMSAGTSNFMNSITFIPMDDFARIRGSAQSVSFVLAKVKPGEAVSDVIARLQRSMPGVTVQSRQTFADQERKLVKDMGSDFVSIMNVIGFLIGLAVIALTTYTATLSRRTEYGMLKALGASREHLHRVVLTQGVVSIVTGFALALLFTLVLGALIPRAVPNMALEVSSASLLRLGGISLVIAGFSSILPILQIGGLEPAVIVRGGK